MQVEDLKEAEQRAMENFLQRIQNLRSAKDTLKLVVSAIEHLELPTDTYVGTFGGFIDVDVTLGPDDSVRSVGDVVLPAIARTREFQPAKFTQNEGHSSWLFVSKNGSRGCRVNVFPGESKHCKLVRVGTRELPVHKLVCAD